MVTAPANDNLLAVLRPAILPAARRLVGERRVTLAFDRAVHPHGFDVRTYRRGPYTASPEAAFAPVTGVVDGRPVAYTLAERPVDAVKGFRMRELRRLCDGGHQTAIVTTRWNVAAEVVAYRMFERGPQENFFRYMRQHFALDALVTYAGSRPISSVRYRIRSARRCGHSVRKAAPPWPRRNRRTANRPGAILREPAPDDAGFQDRPRGARAPHAGPGGARSGPAGPDRETLPEQVPITAVVDAAEVVTLAPEAKHLADSIKMVARRAETTLVHSLAPHDARTEDEERALIRELLVSSADTIPDRDTKCLRVRMHSLANPRSNEALTTLSDTLNALQLPCPATDLRLVYEAPAVA